MGWQAIARHPMFRYPPTRGMKNEKLSKRKWHQQVAPLLCLLLALVACTEASDADTRTDVPQIGGPSWDDETLKSLLNDSWVTDDQSGYFIDDAWSETGSPFSLYDTWWNLLQWKQQSRTGSPIQAASVERWIRPALAGQKNASGLPPIAQIAYAVRISREIGLGVDSFQVSRGLQSLYRDGLYATSKDSQANWGSTALAVESLTALNLPVPQSVIDRVRQTIAQHSTIDRDTATSVLLPALEAAVVLGPTAYNKDSARTKVYEVNKALGVNPDPTWLGASASLRRVAESLNVHLPPISATACLRLAGPDGTVRFQPSQPPDPQLTIYAIRLGCDVGRFSIPPHSRAGWPTADTPSKALRSTIAGLRLAATLNYSQDDYQEKIARTLRAVWVPMRVASTGKQSLTSSLMEMRVYALAAALGKQGLVAEMKTGTALEPADDVARLVVTLSIYYRTSAKGSAKGLELKRAQSEGSPVSIYSVATKELVAQLLKDEGLHRDALRMLQTLGFPNGTFRVGVEGGDSVEPSVTATALAAWISGTSVSAADWTAAGFCSARGCGETRMSLEQAASTSLTTLVLYRSCQASSCGGPFPLVI